jgi:hypothetical protein
MEAKQKNGNGMKFERAAIVSLEEMLELIARDFSKKEKSERTEVCGIPVHLTSIRLRTFLKHGTQCACCGLKGQYFAIEREIPKKGSPGPYHVNLWAAFEGTPVMMTQSSIQATGPDSLANKQTLCFKCNREKFHESRGTQE